MSQYNPQIHNRRSMRLKGYDYSRVGLYFVTICCQDRAHLFGKIIDDEMILNDAGKIANKCWLDIPNHFPNVILHDYIIMPNHVHGIIEFSAVQEIIINDGNVGANNYSPEMKIDSNNNNKNMNGNMADIRSKNIDGGKGAKNVSPPQSPSKTIGSVVRGFKIGVTKWIRQNTDIHVVWQRNYHEHIIRTERAYHNISRYIKNNPANWKGN